MKWLKGWITQSEWTGPSGVFVPEAIALAQIAESLAHDAAEDGTDHAAGHRPFGDAGRPQIDVVGTGVNLLIFTQSVVGEGVAQLRPTSGPFQTYIVN